MLKFKGAYETDFGPHCENCGNAMENWEKIATEQKEQGQVYIFRCKKCKKRIEVYNSKG